MLFSLVKSPSGHVVESLESKKDGEKDVDGNFNSKERVYSTDLPLNMLPQCTEMNLSTGQIVLELLPLAVKSDAGNNASLSTEPLESSLPREGVLVTWDMLALSLTCNSYKEPSAAITCDGAQLLSFHGDFSEYIVTPTKLDFAWTEHSPSSSLDMYVAYIIIS